MSLDRTRERLRRSSVLDAEDPFLQSRYKSIQERFGRDFSRLRSSSTVCHIRAFLENYEEHQRQSYEALIAELLAWPLQSYRRGTLTQIHLQVSADEISMRDDGDGLPLDQWNSERGINRVEEGLCYMPEVELLCPRLHLDPDFGFGPPLVNALSESLIIESHVDGKLWRQYFGAGKAQSQASIVSREQGRGSLVTLRPDPDFFQDIPFPHRGLRRLLFHAAHLCPGLTLTLNGQEYKSAQGLGDLCKVIEPLKSFQRPFFDFEGQADGLIVRVAAMGLSGRPELRCWLNMSSVASGPLLQGFGRAFAESGWTPSLALMHVFSESPSFDLLDQDGECRPVVGEIIHELLCPALRDFAYEHR